MNETKVISTVLNSHEAYDKVEAYVDAKNFTEFGRFCWSAVKEYYELDPKADHVDIDLFQERLGKQYPRRKDLVAEYVSTLPKPGSADNILKLWRDTEREQLGFEIISALTTQREDHARDLMLKFLDGDDEEDQSMAPRLEEFGANFASENLIPLMPSRLNTELGGGLPRQSQVGIFARTNVGKSTFAVNLAGGCLEAGLRVLFISNEEADSIVVCKLAARLSRSPQRMVQSEPSKYQSLVDTRGWSSLRFESLYPGTGKELRAAIKKHKPDVVIVDQIRNMRFASDSLTVNLEQAAKVTRALAKEFNLLMVLITQAGESAKNKLVLDIEDIDWSNTGFQAQLDLLIGIGMNDTFRRENKMMLSFPKWKLGPPIDPFHIYVDYERQLIRSDIPRNNEADRA